MVDMLPADARAEPGSQDHRAGKTFKRAQLDAWVRLAMKASTEFTTWLQNTHSANSSGSKLLTPGQKTVLNYQYLKMEQVWEHDDPIQYLLNRAAQVDLGRELGAAAKQWSPDRRKHLQEFMSYQADAMTCAAKVMEARPILVKQLEDRLATLATEHAGDEELLELIPHPLDEHKDHRLTRALHSLRSGKRDFDLYVILRGARQLEAESESNKKSKNKPVYKLPEASDFDSTFFPTAVQDAYNSVCTAIGKVTSERKRQQAEKERLEAIEKKRQEAIEAAKKKLEEEAANKAIAEAAANVAVAVASGGQRNSSISDSSSSSNSTSVTYQSMCFGCCCFCFLFMLFGVARTHNCLAVHPPTHMPAVCRQEKSGKQRQPRTRKRKPS
jgi:hypothetical protein